MEQLPLIGHMVIFNETSFGEASIRSVVPFLDKLIVIEGAWGTSSRVNCDTRSNDGTIQILYDLQKEYGEKIKIHHCNESNQLDQRSKHFNFYKDPHWLFLIDADEIYESDEMRKLVEATKRTDYDGYSASSWTFVNDRYHYCIMNWPRLFRVNGPNYKFMRPNHLVRPDGSELRHCPDDEFIAQYFHYSYVHPPDRMREKIRDRIATHMTYKWELQDGWMKREGTSAKLLTTDRLPEILKDHPLLQEKAPVNAFEYNKPEKISFMINSGMGNLILATPMLKALRELKPKARIGILTWERGSDIVQGWPVVDDIVTYRHNCYAYHLGRIDHLLLSPTAFIEDHGVFAQADKIIKLAPKANGAWVKHESEYNMDLVRHLGYDGPTPRPEIFVGPEGERLSKAITDSFDNRKIAVVSAGYLRNEHWWLKSMKDQEKIWAAVCDELSANGYHVAFMGSQEDQQDADSIIEAMSNSASNLCGLTDIKTACGVIQRSSLFVGLDGGLAHVASCFEIPSVIVWTFTNPIKNLPLNKNLKLIMNPCPQRIPYCQHKLHSNCTHEHKCRDIDALTILNKVKKVV